MNRRTCFILWTFFLLGSGCTAIRPSPPPVRQSPQSSIELARFGAPVSGDTIQPAGSEVAGAHPVDFYVQTALARNPEIQALERRVAAQSEVIPQVTTLPDPMLSNAFWPISDNSLQTAAGRATNVLTMSQSFPWFGKLRLRGQVAEADTQIALSQLAEIQLKVIEDVKTTYYEIYFSQQAIKITEDNEKFLRDYITLADARYKVAKSSQQDVLRAQVELSKLQDQLVALRRQWKVAQADMAKLLSASPESDLRALDSPTLPAVPDQMERLYEVALATRPELQGRLQAILRDQRRVDLAKLNYFPDVAVGVSWGSITETGAVARMTANGNDTVSFAVGINLPIWQDKLAAGVREAQNRQAESSQLLQVAKDDIMRHVRRLSVQALALEQQVTLYRKEIVPRADQTLRVATADYKVGKVDALTVLDNYTQLLRFQIQQVRLESALGQVLSSLERAVGGQLIEMAPPPKKIAP